MLGVVGISGCSVPGVNNDISPEKCSAMITKGTCPNCGAQDTLNITTSNLTATISSTGITGMNGNLTCSNCGKKIICDGGKCTISS